MFRKPRRFRTALTVAAATVAATLALSACSSGDGGDSSAAKGSEKNPVVIGVVGASNPQWKVFTDLAEKQGIHVTIKDFTDYQQLNPATASGDLDINQFQHILFLADYNNNNASGALVPVGSTAIYPLALYSKQYKAVADIPAGSQIAVPNDGTNQARALGVLASAGLITLKPGTQPLSAAPADVDTSTSKVKVTPVAANQTARSLEDKSVAAAIINNDYIEDTGLKATDAIAQDDPASDSAKPFINIWATTAKNASDPVYAKLVAIAQQPEVEKALQDNSGGTAVLVHETPENLQKYLTDVEAQLKQG